MSIKISALPTVTTVDNSDVFPLNSAGVTSKLAFSSLKSALNFQPLNANLTALAGASAPSSMGLGFLSSTTPTVASYALLGPANTVSYQTAAQVVAYLRANGLGVDTTTAQLLTSKIINGVTLAAGTASTPDGAADVIDSPTDTYTLRLIKVGFTGGVVNFRFTNSTDVTFPNSGVLATVAGIRKTSDATKTAAATLNLDTSDGAQVDVTGTTNISTITLADDGSKTVRFTEALTLVNGANLVLPGGENIITTANDYAEVRGESGAVVRVVKYMASGASMLLRGFLKLVGNFSTVAVPGSANQSPAVKFQLTDDCYVNLPAEGTLGTGIDNASVTQQAPAATTRTYIAGSAIQLPYQTGASSGGLKVGTKLSWKFNMTKTAAGTAASTIDICVGTTGTTADTARLSFTKPAGTAVADEAWVQIEATVRSISVTGVIVGQMIVNHNLLDTGHMTIPTACQTVTSSGFPTNIASGYYIGLCITTGASDSIFIQQVQAHAAGM